MSFQSKKYLSYATVVIDWRTGEILFLERGNTLYQLIHFFDKMGKSWMKNVQAISMDMNAQYAAAVKARYPNIAIVYDGFHIVKNFNDCILTELRRLEQNRLKEEESKTHKSIKNLRPIKSKALANEKKTIDGAIFENQEYLKEIKRKYK